MAMSHDTKAGGFDWLVAWAAMTAACMCIALYLVFAYAPVEATMGIVQKIFYFHVPSAIAAYVAFTISCVASAIYLVRGAPRADVWARAGAEAGVVFCTMVLISGPLWGRKAWGAFWTGEPRLMLTLVLWLTFVAYLVVRRVGGPGEMTRRICAALAILGVVDIPLVRYSVQRWRGNHPRVITKGGSGISDEMEVALLAAFVVTLLLLVCLIAVRVRIGSAEIEADELHRRLARVRRRQDAVARGSQR